MNYTDKIPHRFFWTWDHSTNWCLHALGAQNCGVANVYAKYPEMFERDYMRLIDYCKEHKFDAVGIVGLLRDAHYGVDGARRLCSYAEEQGVKVYMIVGTYSYGGIYYEGDHKYSMDKFFLEHPECVGKSADGEPLYVQFKGKHGYKLQAQGCPSNKVLHDYMLESFDWLFKEIPELGGVQMESGDSGVCQCPDCVARRGEESEYMSVADMAKVYPAVTDVILNRKKDALIICETYHHFTDEACKLFEADPLTDDLKKLYSLPENVYWQWKCDQVLGENKWQKGEKMLKPMERFNHVMRSHAGTQWYGGRACFDVDKIRRQCMLSHDAGYDAVSMFGENAAFHTNAEFNYLAMEYFADHPYNSNDDFVKDVMSPLLGGDEKAKFYFDVAGMHTDTKDVPKVALEIAKITSDIRDYETLRRWQYLASFLNGYYWEAHQKQVGSEWFDSDGVGDNVEKK